jgi:hypothetical protein
MLLFFFKKNYYYILNLMVAYWSSRCFIFGFSFGGLDKLMFRALKCLKLFGNDY